MMTYSPEQLEAQVDGLIVWDNKTTFVKQEDVCDSWLVFVVESGSFHFQIGARSGIATKGDLVLCPPHVRFKRQVLQPTSFVALYFHWYDTAAQVAVTDANLLSPNPAGKTTIHDVLRFQNTSHYLKLLNRRYDAEAVARRSFLLHDLWQQYSWEQRCAPQNRIHQLDPLMLRAEEAIRARAFGPFLLKDLLHELGLSSVQFARRFAAVYGINPGTYVSNLRLDRARTLLLETNETLDEIAIQCGYSSGFYLSRVFSRTMNVSPSAFREAHRL